MWVAGVEMEKTLYVVENRGMLPGSTGRFVVGKWWYELQGGTWKYGGKQE